MSDNHELKSYIDRVQELEEEKRARAEDIREVLAEAKEHGLNPAAIRAVVKSRLMTPEQREKHKITQAAIDEYKIAVGDFITSPLGRAAAERLSA